MRTDSSPAENPVHGATRDHLLEAAGEVFAEVGFRAATVRQICERAGANIAAVNYHFGDKEALYKAVLHYSHQAAIAKFPPSLGLKPGATPEQKLNAFIKSFLMRIFSDGACAWHGKIMTREMIEPTGALEELVRDRIKPMSVELHSILRELMGENTDQMTLQLCAMSVVSQVLFYHHCRPAIALLFPQMDRSSDSIEMLSEHITRFSLAAIQQISKAK